MHTLCPANSPYYRVADADVLEILRDEINTYSSQGDILILGNLNARVGEKQEVHTDRVIDHVHDTVISRQDSDRPVLIRRSSTDKDTNANGRNLLSILNDCHLYLLNGRTTGDLRGLCTYHGYTGSSTCVWPR